MITDPEHLVPCPACGSITQISPEVHNGVPLAGMATHCWLCGAPMTILPTRATVEHRERQRVLIGVGMVAAGDVERGLAYMKAGKE